MIKEVILAKIGLTMETGVILKWLKKEGDFVEQGDHLLEVETDKVTTVVEAFHPGYLKKIVQKEGSEVPVNAVIAYVGEKDDDLSELFSKPQIPFDSPNNFNSPNGPNNKFPGSNRFPGDQGGTGRPVDTIKTNDNSNVSAQQFITDQIRGEYKEKISIVLSSLESSILELSRRDKSKVEVLTTAQFTRIEQIADVFSSVEGPEIDSPHTP